MILQKDQNRSKHRIVLHHIQNILVATSALLIILVILLELFHANEGFLCFVAYLLGALAYSAEICIIILRAKEHTVHRTELVMPVIFGCLYFLLAIKYLHRAT